MQPQSDPVMSGKVTLRSNLLYLAIFIAVFIITIKLLSKAENEVKLVASRIALICKDLYNLKKFGPCFTLRIILSRLTTDSFRFSRHLTPFDLNTKQTKGHHHCHYLIMGLLEDLVQFWTGKKLDDIKEPWRSRWEQTRKYREPVQKNLQKTYDHIPHADLYLTAIGTALTVFAIRRGLRRFRTAQEIPVHHFRLQKKLKGFAICVNDSDNIRFYHSSPLSNFLSLRPTVKRSDMKYETINVRLAGIDAPEMAHFGGECQPYAKEAKEWLTKFVEGRRVTIQLFRYDQYNRAVASVHVGSVFKKNVSVEMVKAGFATIYEDSGAEYGKFEAELRKHEKEAKKKRKGMWQQSWSTYVPPVSNTTKQSRSNWTFWK